MGLLLRKLNCAMVLVCSLFASNVNAALTSVDYVPNSGDGFITRDSETGLDWLDVTLTVGLTFDQVRTGIWYQQGFRYATKEDLQILFLHAETPDDGFDISVTNPAETLHLAQLLSPTFLSGNRVTVMGFMGTDFFGNQVSLQNHPIDVTFSALLGKVDYISNIGSGDIGEAHFTGGHPFSDQASSTYGSFLIRSANPVPEPTTMLLFGTGLAGLAAVGRRKRN